MYTFVDFPLFVSILSVFYWTFSSQRVNSCTFTVPHARKCHKRMSHLQCFNSISSLCDHYPCRHTRMAVFFILSTDNCLYQNSHRLFYKAFLRKHEIWFASVWKRENFIKYFSQLLKSLWTNFCFISLNTNRYSNDKIFIFFFFKFCIILVVVSLSLMGILRSSTNQLFRHVPKTQTFYFDRHYDSFLFDFHFIVCWRYFFFTLGFFRYNQ